MNSPRARLIAEIGINHNGDMDLAERMIATSRMAGADAVTAGASTYREMAFMLSPTLMLVDGLGSRRVTEALRGKTS
jgi:sialic acid synthase SpsE